MSGGQVEPDRPGGRECLSQLSGGLSGFQVDDESFTRIDRKREFTLGEAERRVLRLLAEGHTAKSIVTELGTTPAAVNERLRPAQDRCRQQP